MAQYLISIIDSTTGSLLRASTHKTLTRADHAFSQAVYDSLEAFGKLDTQAAWDCWDRVNAMLDFESVKRNFQMGIDISNTGRTVLFRRLS